MRKHSGTLLCLLALFIPMQARQTPQSPEPQTSTYKAGSEEVLLDVVVRDKKGQLVTNLTPGDLEVYDNGVKRQITSFHLIEGNEAIVAGQTSTGTAPKQQPLDPLRQIRLMTLIFNRLDSVNDRQVARNAALDLIKTELPQNVFGSVLVLDQTIKALQPFTNDREALRKAIERATGGNYTQFDADSQQVEQQLQEMLGPSTTGQSVEEQATSTGTPGNTGPSAAAAAQGSATAAMAQMMLNMLQIDRRSEMQQSGRAAVMGLLDAVREQYRLPGRKSIFLFSDGFSVPQGMEEAYRTVISTANRFNVTFYTVDAHGLVTTPLNDAGSSQLAGAAAASRAQFSRSGHVTPQMAQEIDNAIESGRTNKQNFLAEVADSTGGFLIANENDFRKEMKKAVDDMETYYELSYNPGIEKYDGSFRKIELKTDRSGLRLLSRSGYFALPRAIGAGAQVLAPYEVPLLNAINAKPAPRDLTIRSAAMHFRQGKDSLCDIVVDLPITEIAFQKMETEEKPRKGESITTRFQGEFAYVVLIKNQQGEVVKNFRGDVPLTPKQEQVEDLKRGHFVYTESFLLPAGRYVLETAVMDRKAEKFGVRKSSFFIPESSSSVGISSIALVRSVRDREESTSSQDPFVTGNKIITPTLSAIDKKQNSQGLSMYAVIYVDPANTAKPELTIQLRKDGQNLGGGTPTLGQPDAQGRVQYIATIPLDKIEAGIYEVQLKVKQGSERADEAATFTVE